ncbi:hypothetical protein KBI33_02055 [Candidatus Shapirobacteria bacterium]|nr:hypothetical protein [Candidatus Shapirobacteria bacterium]
MGNLLVKIPRSNLPDYLYADNGEEFGGKSWLKVKELRRLIAGLGFRLIQNYKVHPEENAYLKRSPRADDGEFFISRILKIKSEDDLLEEALSYLYYDNNIREYSALDYQTPYPYLKRKLPEADDKIRFARPIILDEAAVELDPWSGDNVLTQYPRTKNFIKNFFLLVCFFCCWAVRIPMASTE